MGGQHSAELCDLHNITNSEPNTAIHICDVDVPHNAFEHLSHHDTFYDLFNFIIGRTDNSIIINTNIADIPYAFRQHYPEEAPISLQDLFDLTICVIKRNLTNAINDFIKFKSNRNNHMFYDKDNDKRIKTKYVISALESALITVIQECDDTKK
jgi:hypothetical protein